MMHPSMLYKLLVLTLSINCGVGSFHPRAIDHIPRIHAAVFAIPAISASVTVIVEAIASTTAALFVAKAVHDWYEVERLEEELNELQEELEEAEAEAEAASAESEDDTDAVDEQDEPKTVEDILEDTIPGRETNGRSKQFEKEGGDAQAEEDFESLGLTNVRVSGYAKIGELPDGRTVILRTKSEDGRTTLEIQEVNKKSKTKIRYNP